MKTRNTDILDVLLLFARHRTFILTVLIVVSVASVAYALLAPQYWSSHAVLRPVDEDENLVSLGASFMGIGGALLGGGFNYRAEDFITIMESRTFSEEVIRHFNLIDHFEIEEADSLVAMEKTLEKLHGDTRTLWFDEEEGTVHIKILTTDKMLSRDIANYHWRELDEYNRLYKITKSRENRQFLENRLDEVRTEIERLAQEIKSFLEENKAVELDEQSREVIGLYAELVSEKYATDLELEYMRRFAAEDAYSVVQLQEKQQVLADQIRALEGDTDRAQPDYILALDRFPQLQYEYGRLMLEFESQKEIYEFLFPQYEQARIDELKDIPTIEVIDEGRLAGRRAKPKRARLCITNFVLALIGALFASILIDYLQKNEERTRQVWRTLWHRRGRD